MSSAFVKGVTHNLPDARVTFDNFHVIVHASPSRGQDGVFEPASSSTLLVEKFLEVFLIRFGPGFLFLGPEFGNFPRPLREREYP